MKIRQKYSGTLIFDAVLVPAGTAMEKSWEKVFPQDSII
jgi:hypothetical protein